MLQGLGANITSAAIIRAGKCLATVDKVCQSFEEQTSVTAQQSGFHHPPAFGKDLSKIVEVLTEENVFEPKSRSHTTFKFQEGLLQSKPASSDEVAKKVGTLIDTIIQK